MSRKRTLKAEEIISDYLSGLSDGELVNKYQISLALLEEIREQLVIQGTIRVRDIVRDFRQGTSDFELMAKYELSAVQLERTLQELVQKGHLRQAELIERSSFYDDPENRLQTRRGVRTRVRIPLTAYDARDRSVVGVVRDMSDKGFRIASYDPDVGKNKVFLIRAEPFDEVQSFTFEADCRWVREKEKERTYYLAGFEITGISDEARSQLRKLIDLLLKPDT